MRRDVITLALALAAFLGYYALQARVDRQWCYYVATGVLMLWLALDRRDRPRTAVGTFAAIYIAIEAAQQAGCGLLRWGTLTSGRDLCRDAGLSDLYAALGALLLAGALTWRGALWPSRQPRK